MKILDIILETATVAPALTAEQIGRLAQVWIKAHPEDAKALADDALNKQGASTARLFKIIGLTATVVELNLNLYALEQIAKQDLATFRSSDPAFANWSQEQKNQYVDQARDQYYGVFAAQIVSRWVIIWVRNKMPGVRELFNFVEAGLGTKGKIVGEVAIFAFQTFLNTKAGQDFLGNWIMNLIRFAGKGVAGTWDKIWPEIEKYTHLPIGQVNPNTGAAVQANTTAQASGPIASYNDMEKRKADNRKEFVGIAPGSLN
jgi:hypothetical protein